MRYAFIIISFVIICLTAGARAQSDHSTPNPPRVVPETAFISQLKYTNAFFGFALPLPQDSALREYTLSYKGDSSRHFLFGLQSAKVTEGGFGWKTKVTLFTVSATQSSSASMEEARKVASGPKGQNAIEIEIGGKKFWKSMSQQKVPEGKMLSVGFATALNGYVLQFNVESFDGKLTDQFQHSIEAITFFDPVQASEVAGPASLRYSPGTSHDAHGSELPSSTRIAHLNPGVVSGNIYTNDALGFTYEFPTGWIVNDKEKQDKTMEAGHQFAWGNTPSAAREHEAIQQCDRILLFVTKYPEGTVTEGPNPLIAVMAADSACFPGTHFPMSLDDHDAIKELAQEVVRSFAYTPFIAKGQNSVNAYTVQGHVMLDISASFAVSRPATNAPLNVFTSLELTQAKDYFVVWGFVSGSQNGLQELKRTTITFGSHP